MISIGGAHIKPAKPLPNDIKKFIDEAKHGVIYFSLGTVLPTSKLPKKILQPFFGRCLIFHASSFPLQLILAKSDELRI